MISERIGVRRQRVERARRLVIALAAAGAAALVLGGMTGCDREDRDFQTIPPGASEETPVRTSALHAGPGATEPTIVNAYENNAWAIGEGQRLYGQMNCAGCHAPGGGGGIGPALTDDEWIYGAQPENIFDTIVKGRPRGMPSFRDRIGNSEVWKLVAYVRTLNGRTRKDTWAPRSEGMEDELPDTDERGTQHGADTSRVHPEQQAPRPGATR
jgi:cytochrome c oxidase cbb3-type subunit III